MLNGLSSVNIELSSICSHKCKQCGRRKLEKDKNFKLNYGYMDWELVQKISKQIPENITIQFHNNGEVLQYPKLGQALQLFSNNIRCFNTRGCSLLLEKKNEIIENLETITISLLPFDVHWQHQYECFKKFLEYKGDRKPFPIVRFTGKINELIVKKYEMLKTEHNMLFVNRILHSPMGSFKYEKKVVKPEIGICYEILYKLSIDRFGNVSPCVRFDPKGLNILGNLKNETLEQIWTGQKRKEMLQCHIAGNRGKVKFCSMCDFWGIPRGY